MSEMLVAQRHELLLRELRAKGVVRITEVAARYGVSGGTIRRDLTELAAAGLVTKVRGGAVPAEPSASSAPPAEPAPQHSPGPPSPARAAAQTPGGGPTLGLLVPSATYYYPQVVAGVRAAAEERGARVVIGLSNYAEPRDLRQVAALRASGTVGLLVTTTGDHHLPTGTLAQLRASGIPFVLMERQPEEPYEPCEYVVSDHRQGAYTAVRHLHDLGHRRVALFVNGSPTAPLVQEGYRAAVGRLGLDPSAPVMDSGRPLLAPAEAASRYDAFVEACVAGRTRAALVHSDHDAIEIMHRLRVRGLRTPDDVALVAYDDEIAELAEVPLTAVAPPKYEVGAQAARLLLDRLAAPEDGLAERQLALRPRLIVRRSCGAAAA